MGNWIKNHYGLLMALGSGIVIGILGAYADTNRERADYYYTIVKQELLGAGKKYWGTDPVVNHHKRIVIPKE